MRKRLNKKRLRRLRAKLRRKGENKLARVRRKHKDKIRQLRRLLKCSIICTNGSRATINLSKELEVNSFSAINNGMIGSMAQGDNTRLVNAGSMVQSAQNIPNILQHDGVLVQLVKAHKKKQDDEGRAKLKDEHKVNLGTGRKAIIAARRRRYPIAIRFVEKVITWFGGIVKNISFRLIVDAIKRYLSV